MSSVLPDHGKKPEPEAAAPGTLDPLTGVGHGRARIHCGFCSHGKERVVTMQDTEALSSAVGNIKQPFWFLRFQQVFPKHFQVQLHGHKSEMLTFLKSTTPRLHFFKKHHHPAG